jgi:hypothetical protein
MDEALLMEHTVYTSGDKLAAQEVKSSAVVHPPTEIPVHDHKFFSKALCRCAIT